MSQCACYVVRGGALGIRQGRSTHIAGLWHCVWGRGARGNSAASSAPGRLSVTSSATHEQIGPFWCWFPGERFCVLSRTLWVNSPLGLGVSPAASTPIGFFSQRVWGFISLYWNPGLCGLSHSPVVPPSLSARKCGTTPSASRSLSTQGVLSTQLPIFSPPTGLGECFFFNSLVVGLPYSLIFCQFWLFFVFKFVVVLLLVVQGGTVCLPMPPSCLELLLNAFLIYKIFNLQWAYQMYPHLKLRGICIVEIGSTRLTETLNGGVRWEREELMILPIVGAIYWNWEDLVRSRFGLEMLESRLQFWIWEICFSITVYI